MAMESLFSSVKTGHRHPQRITRLPLIVFAIFAILLWISFQTSNLNPWDGHIESTLDSNDVPHALAARQDTTPTTTSSATASSTTALNVFQVSLPVLGSSGSISVNSLNDNSTDATGNASATAKPSCHVTLMEFSFVDSFAKPFVGMISHLTHGL